MSYEVVFSKTRFWGPQCAILRGLIGKNTIFQPHEKSEGTLESENVTGQKQLKSPLFSWEIVCSVFWMLEITQKLVSRRG